MKYCHILSLALLTVLAAGTSSVAAQAQDLIPPVTAASAPGADADASTPDLATTHPMLRLTPDKSDIVRLDRNAVSVIVGNPQHLSVVLDSPKTLVLIPRGAGATYFTVLDDKGEVVMQRHVVVASPKKNYVRIRRSCANDTGRGRSDCQPTSVYFCPDICHEVKTTQINDRIPEPRVPRELPSSYSGDDATLDDDRDEEIRRMHNDMLDEMEDFQDFMDLMIR